MVDELAGRQLAERITPEQLKELRSMVEQMERLLKEGHHSPASDPYHRLTGPAGLPYIAASLFIQIGLLHRAGRRLPAR